MKKRITLILALLLVASLLAACGAMSKEELVGTWEGAWEYNGKQIVNVVELKADGTYAEVFYHNGSFSESRKGTYEVQGNKLRCYENGNPGGPITTYKISSSTLKNADHVFNRIG